MWGEEIGHRWGRGGHRWGWEVGSYGEDMYEDIGHRCGGGGNVIESKDRMG